MVDSVRCADLLGIVERCWAVAVGENVDVRWWKDLQSRFEGGADKVGRFVARDEKGSVLHIILYFCLGSELGWRRVILKDDEKWSKRIATD